MTRTLFVMLPIIYMVFASSITSGRGLEGVFKSTVEGEEHISFDYKLMTRLSNSHNNLDLVEGYWYSSSSKGFPKPIAHNTPFDGQEQFLEKLRLLEQSNDVRISYFRGFSRCRFGDNDFNGSREFSIKIDSTTIRWPEGYRHYIEAHNVVPSREFYRFLESYEI